jgi:site-specific recombinase XerD
VPEPLCDAVAGFADHLVRSRDRARRAGTHPRGHATLEARLTTMRDFAQFLTTRRKADWATVDVGDIEVFLHAHPGRRASYLTGLRQFCRYALRRRLILIDPTAGVEAPQTMAFRGPTLPADRQRELFWRWSAEPDVHPHEAFVGLAALLHGATTQELRHLTDEDVDHDRHRIRLGHRPHPTPLDPWTWTALRAASNTDKRSAATTSTY